jgi:hypothetical protein
MLYIIAPSICHFLPIALHDGVCDDNWHIIPGTCPLFPFSLSYTHRSASTHLFSCLTDHGARGESPTSQDDFLHNANIVRRTYIGPIPPCIYVCLIAVALYDVHNAFHNGVWHISWLFSFLLLDLYTP